jgi:hypothetical protein
VSKRSWQFVLEKSNHFRKREVAKIIYLQNNFFSATRSRAQELCWLTILFQKSILTNKSNMHKSFSRFD